MLKEYEINGMYCSNCAYRIEKRVKSKYNCDAYVDLINNKLYIENADIDEIDLIKTITKMGYGINQQSKQLHIAISIGLLILLMIIAMGPMVGLKLPLSTLSQIVFQFILTTMIYICYSRFLLNGFKSLITRDFKMESLIFLSSSSAYLYSVYLAIAYLMHWNHHLHLYFETGAMILVIIGIGKYLETISKKRTGSDLVKLVNATPQTATILVDNMLIEKTIYEIEVDDVLVVNIGEKIALDGVIIDGNSSFDEALLTGESKPVIKKIGDKVFGSSINLEYPVKVKVTSNFSNGLLGQIISLSKSAQINKLEISNLSDKIAKIFVPLIIIIAVITFIGWLIFGSNSQAFNHMLAVLTISCPCAMGLATPSAVSVGLGIAYRNGILIKNMAIIEELVKINSFVFDKTGTLTNNRLHLESYQLDPKYLPIVYTIEQNSSHPIAKMIVNQLEGVSVILEHVVEIMGKGMKASYQGVTYFVGSEQLLIENGISLDLSEIKNNLSQGDNFILVANEQRLLGYFVFSEELKENADNLIFELKQKNIESLVCSGDSEKAVSSLANSLNITKYYSRVSPSDKAKIVSELTNDKVVAMVGDGINDAVALNSANVAISFFDGSDLAINSGDCILMNNNLMDIVKLLKIASVTLKKIKQNLFWALFYNSLLIPIASGCLCFWNIELDPMYSSIIMSFSSLFVVFNALSIRRKFV